jgi:hypothetical protein
MVFYVLSLFVDQETGRDHENDPGRMGNAI